jgi:asparagine synthase (glutamine-hydrolysing)
MCGIAGVIYFDQKRFVEPAILKSMSDIIVHRGPDDEGFYVHENIGFSFRRLSIIDINLGHQPLSNSDSSLWIVFNGEIYNFRELRKDLQKCGYVFNTNSDTEVIINLYREYGEDCVKFLRGMFGFAIHDVPNHKIFCARDRFGIKPFFYYADKEKFVFGSEIKSILQCPGVDKSISVNGIESYFTYGYITSDYSAYKKIKKLPPSNTLTLYPENSWEIALHCYWELKFEQDFSKTKDQWKEEILASLENIVNHHMISDVPLGSFLSGGIDSSTVVAIMSKLSTSTIKTFSIGFREHAFNELIYAREIAEKYHTEHYEQIIEPESIDLLPLLVGSYDEPFADSSAIPTYYVSKFAREYVTVALSGDGGDELFAGYSSYLKLFRIISNNPFPDIQSRKLFGSLEKIWPEKWQGKGMLYYLALEKEIIGAFYCLWKQNERNKLFNEDFKRHISTQGENLKIKMLHESMAPDFITRLEHLDVQSYMVDDILTKVDRMSMQNSLEVRVPLLDHEFVELAFSIPSSLKVFNGDKKHILKYSVSELLTPKVSDHRKQGFGIPLAQWFKDDLKIYLQDVLFDKNQPMFCFLDQKYIKKQLDNHLKGNRDMSSKLWSLLIFNEWLRQNGRQE